MRLRMAATKRTNRIRPRGADTMSDKSKIEWTDTTWNPIVGCSRASKGCDNCYAVGQSARMERMGKENYIGLTVLNGKSERHFSGEVRCLEDVVDRPRKWKKPRRIFVNSMSDLFHPSVPFDFIDRVFDVIDACPQHRFQILTKRPEIAHKYYTAREKAGLLLCLPNVWLGTSVEDESVVDRVKWLAACPAELHFISYEPALGLIDWKEVKGFERIDWMIVGGESGLRARPCMMSWVEDTIWQCRQAKVKIFVKQLGKHPIHHENGCDMNYGRKGGDIETWPKFFQVREMP